ncbi:MAG: DUF881 domain-containing protein [Tumebacillaceae bacterium]
MKSDERNKNLEGAIQNLPALTPRPELKQEMLSRILAEVQREPLAAEKRRWTFSLKRPAVGFSLSLAGLAFSVLLLIYLVPMHPTEPDIDATGVHQGAAAGTDLNAVVDQQVASLKAEREKELMQQVVPHVNGQYIGEGVTVWMSQKDPTMNRKDYLVSDVESDFDLLRLVQEIYDNGGQVVSINGILVKPYTQIVSHGGLTEVSDRRIQAPFRIKVIGDREALSKQLNAQDSALMQIKRKKDLNVSIESTRVLAIDPIK